jgi:hypothetical protein
MIAKTGAILFAIVVLSFVAALLIANMVSPSGFSLGESIGSLFSLPKIQHSDAEKCSCEYSNEFENYTCNSFCGDLSGAFCNDNADCMI